jgi:hypothetical protein
LLRFGLDVLTAGHLATGLAGRKSAFSQSAASSPHTISAPIAIRCSFGKFPEGRSSRLRGGEGKG